MNIPPCGVKLNTSEISMRKHVNITYTTIYQHRLFGLCYQHQVIELMRLGMVQILLPYQFTWVNEPWNTARKTPLPKTRWFFMVSTLLCQLCSTLLYWGRRTQFKQDNIIVDTVICPLCHTHFYVNRRTKPKWKKIVGMVTRFKNNSQWAHSVSTIFLTGCWNYCVQNGRCSHASPQNIAII